MPARPLSTFASEGWYRPSSARSTHYFRPSDVTRDPLRSLCDHWTAGEGIRPSFTVGAQGRACQACKRSVLDMLLAPQSEPWFPPAFDEVAEVLNAPRVAWRFASGEQHHGRPIGYADTPAYLIEREPDGLRVLVKEQFHPHPVPRIEGAPA